MSDFEKVICCHDRGDDNNLATALLAGKNNNDPMAMAAMMNGGMNNQWNNPFIYLVWMMFAQRMWGNDWQNHTNDPQYGYQALSGQIASFQTRMQDNHNTDLLFGQAQSNNQEIRAGVDKITSGQSLLQQVLCGIESGIKELGGITNFSAERVINAVNAGDCNVIQALKDCCCQNKELVQRMGYENQLGLKDVSFKNERGMDAIGRQLQSGFEFVNRSVERGFSASSFQAQQDKCDIIRANQDNTQRIIDTLNGHWSDEKSLQIQDLKFQNSQLKQNEYFASLVRGGNCGCNRNNNCCQDNCCGGCGCGY